MRKTPQIFQFRTGSTHSSLRKMPQIFQFRNGSIRCSLRMMPQIFQFRTDSNHLAYPFWRGHKNVSDTHKFGIPRLMQINCILFNKPPLCIGIGIQHQIVINAEFQVEMIAFQGWDRQERARQKPRQGRTLEAGCG